MRSFFSLQLNVTATAVQEVIDWYDMYYVNGM